MSFSQFLESTPMISNYASLEGLKPHPSGCLFRIKTPKVFSPEGEALHFSAGRGHKNKLELWLVGVKKLDESNDPKKLTEHNSNYSYPCKIVATDDSNLQYTIGLVKQSYEKRKIDFSLFLLAIIFATIPSATSLI